MQQPGGESLTPSVHRDCLHCWILVSSALGELCCSAVALLGCAGVQFEICALQRQSGSKDRVNEHDCRQHPESCLLVTMTVV